MRSGKCHSISEPAREVGARLITAGFTGDLVFGQTIKILWQTLIEIDELRTVDGLAAKVVTLLGALASGYTAALHRRDFEQSEGRFREVVDAPVGMAISWLDGTVTRTSKIDLDCFGVVNDGLGQGIGDLLLRSVAGRLQALVAGEPHAAKLASSINAELSEPVYLADRGVGYLGLCRHRMMHGRRD
jgi:hypothetical protein